MYDETVVKKRSWKSIIFKIVVIILVLLIAFFLFRSLINKDDKTTSNNGNTFATNFQNLKKVSEKYYTDDKLPTEIGDTNKVTLKELIEQKYIDNLKDSKGNSCSPTNSFAEMKKTASNKYSLKVQLTCDDEQNYIISTITKEENEVDDIDVDVVEKQPEEVENTENKENETPAENTTPVENKESVTTTPVPAPSTSTKTTTKSSTTTKKSTTTNSSTKTTTKSSTSTNTNSNTTTNNTTTNNSTTTTIPKTEVKTSIYYSVSFDPKGSKNIPIAQNVLKGDKASKPVPDPVRNGYTFLGWYYNEQLFDFNTPINQSYTLYAKWKAN
ncbi:MAG: InlB B-repeat-containing protein [Bacilli bacterium]|nr:InlB B-repeat-containing protein [Bacilli bacterium]